MARPKRIYYENAVYHITGRCNNKQPLLNSNESKIDFLNTVSKYKKRFGFKLYCFAIMDNHIHLIIETNRLFNISKVMQAIMLSFSLKFRMKNEYTGHVWQGRFRSKLIRDEGYILECIEYIHNNPVRASFVEKAKDYLWSSYGFYNTGVNAELINRIEVDRFGDTSVTTNWE